ncbi:aromatic amino acid lyase [bacterium]|nr:aromatic amino acid lyase [bacterium]
MVVTLKYNHFFDLLDGKKTLDESLFDFQKIEKGFAFLQVESAQRVVYGVNTGFGPMAQYRIEDKDIIALQYNLIRSHAAGAGKPLEPLQVRAVLLTRLQTLAQGYSAVHPDVIRLLIAFINHEIYPLIPEHGGVGASGDLVQLSHLALTLIGEGEVFYKEKWQPTASVLKSCGLAPLKMRLREGLALINGTAVMTGIGLLNISQSKRLLKWITVASSLLLEIVQSPDDYFSQPLNGVKMHPGQKDIAANMRTILKDSKRLKQRDTHSPSTNGDGIFNEKVQEYYSLRCTPQILGPILDSLSYAEEVVVHELNSVSDNPMIDGEAELIRHGGNFHGDYVALEMDKIRIAITKLTMLAERQINFLFNSRLNEILPPFLNLGKLGLNLGMQGMQFTATSTTAENQTLATPIYTHSIPNNNDNQDIVSMGTNAALLTAKVIENSFQVVAIEMIALTQAVDYLHCEDKLSTQTRAVFNKLRTLVPRFEEDTPKYKEIEKVFEFIKNNGVIDE